MYSNLLKRKEGGGRQTDRQTGRQAGRDRACQRESNLPDCSEALQVVLLMKYYVNDSAYSCNETHTHIYADIHIYIYIYIHTLSLTHTHTHTNTHTHTHTQTQKGDVLHPVR